MIRSANGPRKGQVRSSGRAGVVTFALAIAATAIIGLLLATPERAAATTLRKLGFEELVTRSHVALTGKVTALTTLETQWPGVGTVFFTDVTITVEKVIRGVWSEQQVIVRVPGGTIGEITQLWAGAPRFSRDEQVLLFLRRVGDRVWTTGWEQGKYRLSADGSTVLGSPRLPIGAAVALARLEQYIGLVPTSVTTPSAPTAPTTSGGEFDASRAESDDAELQR